MPPTLDIVMVAYRSEADLPHVYHGLQNMSALPHTLHFYDNLGNKKTLTIAWNDLAREGSADYIVFLNTDIRLSPEWDARLVAALERYPDAGAVMPKPVGHDWPKVIDPSRQPFADSSRAPAPTHEVMTQIAELYKDRRDDYSFGGSCNAAFYAVMVRRSTWMALKGFDERYRFYGQDHDFQRRLFTRFKHNTVIIANAPAWHRCGGSVQKAAERGEVDFGGEMRHCGAMNDELKADPRLEWDLLSDADRASVRSNRRYNRMPTH